MEKIIFSKFSNDRRKDFSILTKIIEKNNKKEILKIAAFPEGEQHLKGIYKVYKQLVKQYNSKNILINKCSEIEDSLKFEYIYGNTLKEIFDEFQNTKNKTEFLTLLDTFINCILCELNDFSITDEFVTVFGNIEFPFLQKSMKLSNIDLIFDNIIYNNCFNMIDYEWTFDFPVPYKFIIYRMIFYYMQHQDPNKMVVSKNEIFKLYEISKQEQICFNKMEENFQAYILGNIHPLRKLSHEWIKIIDMPNETNEINLELQIFLGKNETFVEKDSYKVAVKTKNGHVIKYLTIKEQEVDTLRIDPGSNFCMLKDLQIQINNINQENFRTNGMWIDQNKLFFDTTDPQMIFPITNDIGATIVIEFDYIILDEITAKTFSKLNDTIQTSFIQINNFEQQIQLKEQEKNTILLSCNEEINRLKGEIKDLENEKREVLSVANETIRNIENEKNKELLAASQMIQNIEEERNNLNQRIENMMSSNSWKLTKPLRKISTIVKPSKSEDK